MKSGKTKVKGKVSKALKKYVKTVIDRSVEDKHAQVDWSRLSPIPATSLNYWLLSHGSQLVQGTGSNNRLGDVIKLKELKVIISLRTPSTYNSYCRVMLVQFKNPNGIDLTTSDFMAASAGAGPDRPLYPPTQLGERVKILYDKTHHVTCTGNVSADYNYKQIRITKKNLNIKQQYIRNSNIGTYADVEKNSVYLVLLGSVDNGSVARCELNDLQHYITYEDA